MVVRDRRAVEKGNEPGIDLSGIAVGAASGAAAVALASRTKDPAAPATYSPEDRELLQDVYRGADRAGLKIVGIAKVTQIADAFAGSKAHPVAIGKTVTLTVGLGKDGSLMAPDDERATSTLTIDVRPGVEFDSDGDAHVVWHSYARRVDKATRRVTATGKSGPTAAEWEAKTGGRPSHVVGNDPAVKDWIIESLPDSPEEATSQALTRIGVAP